MRVDVETIVKDPSVTAYKELDPTERVTVEEEFFLDGPISPRVAVLDFDETTGALLSGLPFEPPETPEGRGRFRLERPGDLGARDFIRASVFGAVYKTIRMFEEADALGRRVRWAFDMPQLFVVPLAGRWENAFYQRESRSLQFFYFDSERGTRIHTAKSQDIVAHETAHAVLDGLAPDLYDATLPEALAIHEAVADLAAVLNAFRSRALARRVLEQTRGSIERSSAFNSLAPEFAEGLDPARMALRDLLNDTKLHDVDRADPHALSQVLSGALYKSVVRLHDALRREFEQDSPPSEAMVGRSEVAQAVEVGHAGVSATAAAAKALYIAAKRLQRILVRGLDYLPPGEASFVDLGRALWASDAASHPDSADQRDWIAAEFAARGVIGSASDLEVPVNIEDETFAQVVLEDFVDSDWLAYDLVNKNRELFRIPRGIPFRVLPRLDVRKRYYHRDERVTDVRECLLKISWTELERNRLGSALPAKRRVIAGTTVAIDWESKRIRAIVRSEGAARGREDRDEFLGRLVEADRLRIDGDHHAGGRVPAGVACGSTRGNVLRVRGTAGLLHFTEG